MRVFAAVVAVVTLIIPGSAPAQEAEGAKQARQLLEKLEVRLCEATLWQVRFEATVGADKGYRLTGSYVVSGNRSRFESSTTADSPCYLRILGISDGQRRVFYCNGSKMAGEDVPKGAGREAAVFFARAGPNANFGWQGQSGEPLDSRVALCVSNPRLGETGVVQDRKAQAIHFQLEHRQVPGRSYLVTLWLDLETKLPLARRMVPGPSTREAEGRSFRLPLIEESYQVTVGGEVAPETFVLPDE